jgi:hypothetical protein
MSATPFIEVVLTFWRSISSRSTTTLNVTKNVSRCAME